MRRALCLLVPSLAACSPGVASVDGDPARERMLFDSIDPHVVCRERTVDADGSVSSYVWRGSADGVPTSITERDASGTTKTTWFRQDGDDVDILVRDGDDLAWWWQRLEDGRVVAQGADYSYQETDWTYDEEQRLVGFSGSEDGYGYTWRWSYDESGRVQEVGKQYKGYEGTRWSWDSDGRLAAWTRYFDGSADDEVAAWDSAGLPTLATGHGNNSAGTEWDEAWSWTWDDHGNLTSETGPLRSYALQWTYSDDGSYRVDGLGGHAYTWAASGKLLSVDKGSFGSTQYSWDDDETLRAIDVTAGDGSWASTTTLTGPCPEAAWAWRLPDIPSYGPFPALPTIPRPWGR